MFNIFKKKVINKDNTYDNFSKLVKYLEGERDYKMENDMNFSLNEVAGYDKCIDEIKYVMSVGK